LDKAKIREIALQYSEEVKKVLTPTSIILFGSHVNGNPHEWSDIDIAVFVNDIEEENWYDTCVLLQKLRRKADFIDIEPHLLSETYDPSGFTEHIIKTGEVLYQSA